MSLRNKDVKSAILKVKHRSSLTLLEIIISMIILALVTAGLVNLFLAAKRHSLHSRSRITGGELGRHFLDPLQSQVRQDSWSTTCLGTGNCSSVLTTLSGIEYNANYQITDVSFGNDTTTLRRARVILNWNEPSP